MHLTVVCWLWQGWRPLYNADHVNALQRMLADNLSLPHQLVCVTDNPRGIKCPVVPLWDHPVANVKPLWPNCYLRLRMFSEEAQHIFGDRVLSIDLDCVMLQDITPLITDHDFRIVKGIHALYNGSMWLHRTGTRRHLWETFNPDESPGLAYNTYLPNGRRYLGSDQAWISYASPGEAVWSTEDGVHLCHGSFKNDVTPRNARLIFFPGHRKPWDDYIKEKYPQIAEAYSKYL